MDESRIDCNSKSIWSLTSVSIEAITHSRFYLIVFISGYPKPNIF